MSVIIERHPLGFNWVTQNPFLFCVHHLDKYPSGNESLGPNASLKGRQLGHDFDLQNDWKMYHGHHVPGFPVHPHRGFETVTVVLEGFVDHFDSAGACGRYGQGDVQWMTAGRGLQHAEMFPLVSETQENTLHLFQIWLNLPQKDKFVAPHYKMLWHEEIPFIKRLDPKGFSYQVRVIAGSFEEVKALAPAPDSYAHDGKNAVQILLITLSQGATLTLPATSATTNRTLYAYKGDTLTLNGETLSQGESVFLKSDAITLINGQQTCDLLYLQGERIDEPVIQYGPFVMNTKEEIQKAYDDYHQTGFGGWPWDKSDPVMPRTSTRVANYSDGTVAYPPLAPKKE